jgi:DNA-directed RNA polymerase subunit M/transcription elongation factor TFIIS
MSGHVSYRKPNALPTVYWSKPRCPECDAADLHTRRSLRLEDSSTRWVTCRTCGKRFILVME